MSPKVKQVPTLADVARLAEVSTATVSRCLNEPERVVEPTRERVMAAVKELGYTPNFGARALAAKRTKTIGAIIPTMENSIFARGLQAFQEELGEYGLTLLVASSSYRPDLEEEQIRTLVSRGADALFLIGHDRDPAIYRFLENRGVPVLVAWTYDPRATIISVGFNNREAMEELANHVISKRHIKIGMIAAKQEGNDRSRDRVEGVRDAMIKHGLNPGSLAIHETTYSIANGRAGFQSLMTSESRPTVVICGNDVLAVGALQMAHQMGFRVPEDVSITGFDDIELATVVNPPLTTVHVPHRAMGREAARMLHSMLEGTPPSESVKLETDVRLRGTLGPPQG